MIISGKACERQPVQTQQYDLGSYLKKKFVTDDKIMQGEQRTRTGSTLKFLIPICIID